MTAPKEQPHLYGHEDLEASLYRLFKANRLPHSLLITGPRGVGKATLAMRLVRFLLSGGQTSPSLFGESPFFLEPQNPLFRRIAAGGHGDFLLVEPEDPLKRDIPVDAIRQVRRFLSSTPMEGGWRIVLIDGQMNRNAGNALLKVLEEPPKKSLLIVLAESAGQVIPTIRSRCQHLKLSPLPDADVKKVLKSLYPAAPEAELTSYVSLSDGCPGQAVYFYQNKVLSVYQDLLNCLRSVSQNQAKDVIAFCEKYAAKPRKDTAVDYYPLILNFLLRVIYLIANPVQGESTLLEIESQTIDFLKNKRTSFGWAEKWGELNQSIQESLRFHLDRYQVLTCALFSL